MANENNNINEHGRSNLAFIFDEKQYVKESGKCQNVPIAHENTEKCEKQAVVVDSEGERGQWNNKLDFFFSLLSAAVGLGNIWRFPYLCFKHGGGAFLIPYAIVAVTCGVPLFLLEISVGQYLGIGTIPALGQICPMLKGAAWATITLVSLMDIYVPVIIGWSFFYVFSSLASLPGVPWAGCENTWNTADCYDGKMNVSEMVLQKNFSLEYSKSPVEEYWTNHVLELTGDISEVGNVRWELVGCVLLAWVLIYIFIWKGLHSSGKMIWFVALFPYFLLMILLVRAVMLDGAADGLMYYVTPQWDKLKEVQTWIDAATQVLFSYSIACSTLIVLGSYNKFNHNCYRDAILVSVINSFTSLIGGVVTFSVLGHMAFLKETSVQNVAQESGPGLAFLTYPEVITKLPAAPLWTILFFGMMITIGIDTQFCDVEAVLTSIVDSWPEVLRPHRKKFVLCVVIVKFLLAFPMITQGGIYIFQLMDSYAGSGIARLWAAFFQVVAICWLFGVNRIYKWMHEMLGFNLNLYWKICWVFISPCVLAGLFLFYCFTYESPVYGKSYTYPLWGEVMGIGMSAVSMICVPLYAVYYVFNSSGTPKETIRKGITPAVEMRKDAVLQDVHETHTISTKF